jgi:CheY-like chemotaxis protein
MGAAGRRMTEMIEELLDLTRARLGGGLGFARTRGNVDIRELVLRSSDELQDASGQSRIEITTETATATSGDPDRLLQLFSNVLANALAHGHQDRGIAVSIGGTADDIVVTIANHGAIAAALVPSLFEPFRAQSRTGRSNGLGLGMFIARQIAIAHRGDITAEATADDRTVVTIKLPRHAGVEPDARTVERPDGLGQSVLIVEDEAETRETLREAFERQRYRVATATNGKEALEQMLRDASLPDAALPDVLVLDLVMPVLDGRALYRAMQQNPRLSAIPVVVSTADPALAPSGPVVLAKPVKLSRLLDEVAQLGARRRVG